MFTFKVECRRYILLKIQTIKRLEINFIKSIYPEKQNKNKTCREQKAKTSRISHERFYSGQWDRWVIWFPERKKKRCVNEKRQDQQPEATSNASCKLFHCSHTASLHVGLPSSSQQRLQVKTAASPDVAQLTGISDTPTRTLMSLEWGGCGSTRSPPSQPAPVHSLKRRSPRTSARRWRPDGTCSSSPRPLSSTVWFPAWGGEKTKGW